MRHVLKDSFLLRGWDLLPYAVVDARTGSSLFVNDATFHALGFCDGEFDANNPVILPIHRQIIADLVKHGIVEETHEPRPLPSLQKYHRFPCRYIARAHWSITGRCNYRCRHCYMSAAEAKYGELSREQCLAVVEQLAEAGIYQVSLTGGEPLVRPDFLEIVDALIERRISICQIYSNGALVNDKLLDELESRGIRPDFSISFDGVGWHDWLRGIDGAEQRALDVFKLLQKRGFPSSVEMCLHKGNLHTLGQTIRVLAEHGVRSVKTSPVTDAGEWLKENGQYTLTAEELCEAYLEYIPKYKAAGALLSIMLGGSFFCPKGSDKYRIPFKKYDGSEKMLRQTLCRSARNTMYIAADGTLLPCIPLTGSSLQDEMPKITETGLIEALSDSKYLRAIDTRLEQLLAHNEKCNACEYRLTCGGGCRAGALFTTGDYLGCDEYTCYFFKNKYEEKIKAIYAE